MELFSVLLPPPSPLAGGLPGDTANAERPLSALLALSVAFLGLLVAAVVGFLAEAEGLGLVPTLEGVPGVPGVPGLLTLPFFVGVLISSFFSDADTFCSSL